MKPSAIMLSNRTKEKAEDLKKNLILLKLLEWGKIKNCDLIINTTSVGLKKSDKIPLNFK